MGRLPGCPFRDSLEKGRLRIPPAGRGGPPTK